MNTWVQKTGFFLGLALLSACTKDLPFVDDEDGGVDVNRHDGSLLPDASDISDLPYRKDSAPPLDAAATCPQFAMGTIVGRTPLVILTEASGIVASRRNPGTLWTHNDSGAGPRILALSNTGTTQAQYDLGGASARDWEDIAMGPGPIRGQSYVYVGDIGDNAESRSNVDIYRVAEPDVTMGSPTPTTLSGVDRFTLSYPDRAHNAETLLVDPENGDVFIITKSSNGVSLVFRAAAPLVTGKVTTMTQVAVLKFGTAPLPGNRLATGGDISPMGDEIAIRSYDSAFLWRRPKGMSIADALSQTPCSIPLASEPQGEALGFAQDGSGYYSVSEGSFAPIYYYARR